MVGLLLLLLLKTLIIIILFFFCLGEKLQAMLVTGGDENQTENLFKEFKDLSVNNDKALVHTIEVVLGGEFGESIKIKKNDILHIRGAGIEVERVSDEERDLMDHPYEVTILSHFNKNSKINPNPVEITQIDFLSMDDSVPGKKRKAGQMEYANFARDYIWKDGKLLESIYSLNEKDVLSLNNAACYYIMVEEDIWRGYSNIESAYNDMPFSHIPRSILRHMASNAVFWLNAFPHDDGVSAIYSPRYLFEGRQIDFNKHVRIPFGAYAQTHEIHDNSMVCAISPRFCSIAIEYQR